MVQLSYTQIAAILAMAPSLATAVPVSATTTTESALSCPGSDGTTITVGADSFNIQCGVDYYGGDLTLTSESSFENCIATCENTAGCIVVSFTGSTCYMKNKNYGAQANANVWAATKVSTTAPGTVLSCPASDGATYTAKDGATWKVECGVDRYGSDMGLAWSDDLQSCIDTCNTTPGCVDVSYRSGTGGAGPCYLKNRSDQEARTDSGVWGARRIAAAPVICAVRGNAKLGGIYIPYGGVSLSTCKSKCANFNVLGRTCKAYGYSTTPLGSICTLSAGSPAPVFANAFTPSTNGLATWYDLSCAVGAQ